MAGCALNKSHLETETRGQSAIAPGAMFDEWAFFLTPRWACDTLWLCQNSYWKLPFIVDFPTENGDFP